MPRPTSVHATDLTRAAQVMVAALAAFRQRLPAAVRRDLVAALALQAAAAGLAALWLGWGLAYLLAACASLAVALLLVALSFASFARLSAGTASAPAATFGAANRVTLLRLALAMLLAATLAIEPLQVPSWLPWAMVALATAAALLDALDGPLARRFGLASAFGARFDMETDAWFTLVLSTLAWQLERAGPWVLAAGALRYAFVAAAWQWPWLAQPLPPSRLRQSVCVVQIVLLIVALAPIWHFEVSSGFCAVALALLAASFARDVRWLWRRRASASPAPDSPAVRGGNWFVRFAVSAFVLNTLLTFESRFDGRGVLWSPRLSFDLCVAMLLGVAWFAWRWRPAAGAGSGLSERAPIGLRGTWPLAVLCLLLVIVRCVDVMIAAWFGRPVNLYWDAPHAWQLLRLAWSAWSPALVLGGALAVLLLLALLLLVCRWAVATLAQCLQARAAWPWLGSAGLALLASFVAYPFVAADTRWFFALPVTPVITRQAELLGTALAPDRTEAHLSPSPSFAGNVDALRRADVLLLFAESYGISTFEQPAQAAALAGARARLLQAARSGGRQVVSARVRSPTFGGGSWLAHAALLSGVDTHDPGDYELLLTSHRPTLVTHFARHGYRTIGWMPGMHKPWPEGSFYGFHRYADAKGVGYRGPTFGYWAIPDQASMALLHAQELGAAAGAHAAGSKRQPRFVVFPTLATHAPFHPLAPYQPDWQRLLTALAYTPSQVAAALAPAQAGETEGWVGAYVRALSQTFEWLGSYLAERASPQLVTIVVGDHQALAAVSGAGASWDVPVHVFSSDALLIERLRAAGFVSGLAPGARSLGAMHELTALLVQAFDMPGVDVAGPAAPRQ